jgi:hypothetical protein
MLLALTSRKIKYKQNKCFEIKKVKQPKRVSFLKIMKNDKNLNKTKE